MKHPLQSQVVLVGPLTAKTGSQTGQDCTCLTLGEDTC